MDAHLLSPKTHVVMEYGSTAAAAAATTSTPDYFLGGPDDRSLFDPANLTPEDFLVGSEGATTRFMRTMTVFNDHNSSHIDKSPAAKAVRDVLACFINLRTIYALRVYLENVPPTNFVDVLEKIDSGVLGSYFVTYTEADFVWMAKEKHDASPSIVRFDDKPRRDREAIVRSFVRESCARVQNTADVVVMKSWRLTPPNDAMQLRIDGIRRLISVSIKAATKLRWNVAPKRQTIVVGEVEITVRELKAELGELDGR